MAETPTIEGAVNDLNTIYLSYNTMVESGSNKFSEKLVHDPKAEHVVTYPCYRISPKAPAMEDRVNSVRYYSRDTDFRYPKTPFMY